MAVDSKSLYYKRMEARWQMTRDILAGTRAMRDARELYLPKHAQEEYDMYNRRLARSVFHNVTKLTLNSLVGKPFSDPVSFRDGTPDKIIALESDITMTGEHIHSFLRSWFKEGLAKRTAYCMVSYPPLAETDTPRTKADDLKENRRPWFTLISPENMYAFDKEYVNGVHTVTRARILEERVEEDEKGEEVLVQYMRVITSDGWELHKDTSNPKSTKKEWTQVDSGENVLGFVPIVEFNANEEDETLPLEDLMYLNIQHWQLASDLFNNTTVANFPVMAVSGARAGKNKKKQAVTPNVLLSTTDPQGRYYYVEQKGSAIATGENRLDNILQDMAAHGAEFLRKRPGGQSAKARTLDAEEATSPLQDMTYRFIAAVDQALAIAAKWMQI